MKITKRQKRFAVDCALLTVLAVTVHSLPWWRYLLTMILAVAISGIDYKRGMDDGIELTKDVWKLPK